MKNSITKAQTHFCPVESGIELLAGKWKGRILWKLYNQPAMRFGEFRRNFKADFRRLRPVGSGE